MTHRFYRFLVLFSLTLGCEVYHKQPLDKNSVDAALAPVEWKELRMRAEKINHPVLKPVVLDESKGLTPEQAGVVAVLVNPGLRALRDRRGVAQAELIQAKLLPNPELSAGLEFPTAGNLTDTFNAWGLDLSWDLSALISYGAHKHSAQSRADEVDLDIAWQEWQVAEGTKAAVYKLIALDREVKLSQEISDRLAENAELIKKAAERGLMNRVQVAAAVSAGDAARRDLLDLEKQQDQERLNLNYLLGQPPEARVKLSDEIELPRNFSPPPAVELTAGLEDRRLDLLALRKGYDAQESALRAAVLQQFPKIGIGVIEARDTSNVITTGFGVTISLPIFDRNQGQVALEKATRQALFDEYADRVAQARIDIARLTRLVLFLDEAVQKDEDSLKNLQALYESYRVAWGRGDADALSYYEAWNNFNQKQVQALALRQELAEAVIGLELASGRYRIEPVTESKEGK
jgi:outer membrane protein, heavy metal efflux system